MSKATINTILVPVDFSECSLAAMEHAVALADVFGARVLFLHVIEPPAYGLEVSLAHPGVDPEATAKVAAMMASYVDRVKVAGLQVTWHLETGVPFAEINAAIERHGVDLVVMGTHGRTGLAHVLLGSVAERVVQHAPCPVLTVKGFPRGTETVEPAHAAAGQPAPATAPSVCRMCGRPAGELICEACKVKVQAEAYARKAEIEKEGRVGTGRR